MSLPAAPHPGRPKDSAKRAAILAAATTLFTRQPYDLVKMEEVATLAKVSKMTVYSHFRDKETLFESIVSSVSDAMLAALATPAPGEGTLQDRLSAIGRDVLHVLLGPEIAALCHSLPGALRTNRELGPRFYNAGPGRAQAALAEILQRELELDDPSQAANELMSLWEGGLPARIAFGVADVVSDDEIERRARRGTALFLKAYGKEAVLF